MLAVQLDTTADFDALRSRPIAAILYFQIQRFKKISESPIADSDLNSKFSASWASSPKGSIPPQGERAIESGESTRLTRLIYKIPWGRGGQCKVFLSCWPKRLYINNNPNPAIAS